MDATCSGLAGVPPEESIQRTTVQTGHADTSVETHVANLYGLAVSTLVQPQGTAGQGAGDPKSHVVRFVPCAVGGCSSDGNRVHEAVSEELQQVVQPGRKDEWGSEH